MMNRMSDNRIEFFRRKLAANLQIIMMTMMSFRPNFFIVVVVVVDSGFIC
jgi:hypothetical protein